MFSSLASFIFGSNTSATTNNEANQNPIEQQEPTQQQGGGNVRIDADNTIEVTSSTPSVTGAINKVKRGKNKRSRNNKNKRQALAEEEPKSSPSITTLLAPSTSFNEDFDLDESDWFIVEKEDEEESLPRTDSEEELSIVEVKPKSPPATSTPVNNVAQQRRRQHISSHSLYSGPRPQQQRNFLQRARNSGARGGAFNVSKLSPPRSISDVGAGAGVGTAAADSGVTQSLYVVSPNVEGRNGSESGNGNGYGANISMDESWFVTPPPCFTSIGPINMETSPFENLLIEHPSMSVYHSIRSAQEAAESFVNLDLGVAESQQQRVVTSTAVAAQNARQNAHDVQQRSGNASAERYSAIQLKQELFARKAQKQRDIKERQNFCRGAIERTNKVRDFQSKGRRQRRSDMQHCKVISGANNNRKGGFY